MTLGPFTRLNALGAKDDGPALFPGPDELLAGKNWKRKGNFGREVKFGEEIDD